MKLSVIVATRNRAHVISQCLDSIAVAFAKAAPLDAEIVVVDNGSTDETAAVIQDWIRANTVPVQPLFEPRPGKARALNRALRVARGELLAFTDDDCRLHPEYVNDLLRHDGASSDLVLRGGRIELGDPTDLPITVVMRPGGDHWKRSLDSAKYGSFSGIINGCNMTMRRTLVEQLGSFDENFGPGAPIHAGEDTEYLFMAYTADAMIEYVPDMAVSHHHGRKTADVGHELLREYMIGGGAISVKYLFRHPSLCRPFYWDIKRAIKDRINGTNTFMPNIGFSHEHKVKFAIIGAVKYFFLRKGTQRPDQPLLRRA